MTVEAKRQTDGKGKECHVSRRSYNVTKAMGVCFQGSGLMDINSGRLAIICHSSGLGLNHISPSRRRLIGRYSLARARCCRRCPPQ